MDDSKNYIFVCGCPRSGTTAMWSLLTAAEEAVIGVERYGKRVFSRASLTPELFEQTRFFTLQEGDTFYSDLDKFQPYYALAREKFARATIFGDKIPKLYERFDSFFAAFPRAKVIFMFRNIFDVAASYKRRSMNTEDSTWGRGKGVSVAIRDWAKAITAYKNAPRQNILPICYEDFFIGGNGLEQLASFVGVADKSKMQEKFVRVRQRSEKIESTRARDLNTAEIFEICLKAPFGAYREILSAARIPGAPAAAPQTPVSELKVERDSRAGGAPA